jgi:hypothetical protein
MQKVYFIFCALFMLGTNARSQQSYTFEQTTATYADLVGATNIPPGFLGTGEYFWFDELIGENFWFYKTPFPLDSIKTIGFQTNGNLRIDNDSSLIIIDGAFTFLDSIDNTSAVSYKIEGSGGNKIIKVQWKNLRLRNGQTDNYMNMQIWVYQAGGIIEFRYGASSASNQSGFSTSKGPNVGMFYAHADLFNNPKMYEKLWLNGSPGSLQLDSNRNFTFKAMAGLPVGGTVYRFVPRFATGLSPQGLGWQRVSLYPNPVADKLFIDVDNQNLAWQITLLTGQQVASGLYETTTGINTSGLLPGMYLLLVDEPGQPKRFARFVKQ